jgi:hypothetical protein
MILVNQCRHLRRNVPRRLRIRPRKRRHRALRRAYAVSGIATLLPHRAHAPRRRRPPTVAILTGARRRVKLGRTTLRYLTRLRRLIVQPPPTLRNQSPNNHQLNILFFHNHSVTTTFTAKKIAFPVFRRNKMLDNVIVLLNLAFVRANILEMLVVYW